MDGNYFNTKKKVDKICVLEERILDPTEIDRRMQNRN
jgi:hypothetical protein